MRILKYIIAFICIHVSLNGFGQQPFTAGNIVVYRVGDGSSVLTFAAAKVYLDEYTPNGALVQSILMPTATSGNNTLLTAYGNQISNGLINLSADGKYVVVPGVDVTLGTTNDASAAVIGLVDFNGRINTSTAIGDYFENDNIPRTAVSDNGSNIWLAGYGAIRYAPVGSNTSVMLNSATVNDIKIVDGQLYASVGTTLQMAKVGTGLPITTGQTISGLPGIPSTADIRQFAFADLDANIPGSDVLYVADRNTGIRKYSLVSGTWASNGVVGANADAYVGLTVKVSGSTVTVFATRKGPNTNFGGELVKLIDNSGYNGALTGTPVSMVTVATPNTMMLRGVALVPQPAPFTAGNIVVYRVGDGSSVLTFAAAKVYLDEYNPNGALVQSILMPTATSGNNTLLTAYGNQISNGLINLSADGKYVVVPGVDVTLGTTNDANAAVIGLVDFNGRINTSTAIGDYFENDNIPRTAVSDDGSNIWLAGYGAIRYAPVGSSTSVKLNSTTVNDIKIVDGELYASVGTSLQMAKVGTGLPTTAGQTISGLPGIPSTADIRQFAFADLDANIPGSDVLYVADRNTGIRKYSLVSGTWVSNGVVGANADAYVGLTVKVSGSTVTVFATRKGPNTSFGGELVKLIDNSGYNGALTGTPVSMVTVATPNTMMLRGLTRVPLGCPSITGLRVPDVSATQANIAWDASVMGSGYEYAITTSSLPPASGTATSNTYVNITGLTSGVTYYAHVKTRCSALSTSEWTTVSFITGCSIPALPLINININSAGVVAINWKTVFGAAGYEYFISTNVTPPGSGVALNDTSIKVNGLNAVTKYYFHLRSNCGSGTFSAWVTKPFSTNCFVPATTLSVLPKNVGVSWAPIPNAVKYEYALTFNAVKPLSGTYTSDTSYIMNQLNEATAYYFHVRAVCSTGTVSDWSTIPFNMEGIQAYPNPVRETLYLKLNGITNPTGEVVIGDAMGRVITRIRPTGNSLTIDTRGWLSGIYLVRYSDDRNKYTTRILKQ